MEDDGAYFMVAINAGVTGANALLLFVLKSLVLMLKLYYWGSDH